jgi:hypothetical protein
MTCDPLPLAAKGKWTLWVRGMPSHWRFAAFGTLPQVEDLEEAERVCGRETLVLPSPERPMMRRPRIQYEDWGEL